MSTDPLETKFDRFRDATVMTGTGGPRARANVRRSRRHAALFVLVAAGVLLTALAQNQENGLTPASSWQETVPNARMDLSTQPRSAANCAGPVVQFHDGKASVRDGGRDWDYVIADGPMATGDINRDGRTDYIVTVGCGPAEKPECHRSKADCDRILAVRPLYIAQVFVLTGEPDDLTAIGGIHAYLRRPDRPVSTDVRVSVTEDGAVRVDDDTDPEHAYTWRYQDGKMVISR